MESIHFRNGTKKDIGVLAELFRETVCRINSRDYSPEQIAAWTGGATPKRWDGLFSGALRFILAERDTDGAILGFTAADRDCWSRRKHMRICRVPFGSLPK